MPAPEVTVITPAYNCGKYVLDTMKSVLSQSYENLDYVVIDDASTEPAFYRKDGSGALRDRRLTLLVHDKNQGEQATVNEGLRLVKGKYFMIVNADDPLLPGAITTLVEFMESHPDVLCAYPDWDCIDEEGKVKFHVQSREYDFAWMVAHHTWIPSVGSIFRSDLIKIIGYRDESFRWLGDADYWLRVGLAGKMARVPETLATWRYHNGQASADRSDKRAWEHTCVTMNFWLELPEEHPYWQGRMAWQSTAWSYLVAAVVAKSPVLKARYVAKAIKEYPELLISPDFYSKLASRAKFFLRRAA